ncbi:receptor-like protein EIX2 [Brachypodium distachyon]|uniref:Uncharacterized protein n=1 Tax=Brachypodium distachyon TaxID=15368 RepID=I1I235_BRADI|nr:receptor-like protein EIX2 [Brachypodium distachyon]PNT66909.1 hypothetical protein BRADI_3g18400v3 [Brachypodium distachyon]PNT66910.1 hypothetical protein BRADI_3g18400v3 [Brachypodium distachyon]|eukprot:XP_014755622.1 receptor-like protein EIX2 [Brachypodium distachyon]
MYRIANLLFILIIIQSTSFFASGGSCIPAERAALLSFKKGITNDSADLLTSWHGQDCCWWRGIICNNQTGHVVELRLRNPNYMHGYPCDSNGLFGKISPSLLSLKHLEHLDLSMNCLPGKNGSFPEFLGSMENLQYLNLFGIPFIGRVPPQLGNLSKLQYLYLGMTAGYSKMYSTDITWLTKLPLLQNLSMSTVQLSGIDNWPHTLNMIPSLRVISLSECSLDSANQSLLYFNLTKLEKVDLSWNNLHHSIASSWFWKAKSLKYLYLMGNSLFGQFPETLGNMTFLQVLDISMNSNKDMMMARNLKNLCSLEILDLSRNWINRDIAVFMERLPQCARKKLQELYLSYNSFTGTLPNLIVKFTSLNVLDLSMNNLNGSIPLEIGHLASLTDLDLSDNLFSASVPFEVGALTNLMSLDLSNNSFSGPLPPEIVTLAKLTTLDLSINFFSASVPSGIGALTNLMYLDLSNNKFNGSVNTEIGSLTHLTRLALSNNKFSGSVPAEIGYLSNLFFLNLSSNNFSGVITEEHFTGLINLKFIDLSFNSLKVMTDSDWLPPFSLESAWFANCEMGPLFPSWLQWQPEITTLGISSTALKGDIPDWFWSKFSTATYLDISNNQISGSLPADLKGMAFEKLYLTSNRLTGPVPLLPTNIIELDISNNTFSGTLPSDLEGPRLEILLMYSNQIVGHIPESLCKLGELQYLDMSNNIIEGEIPQCFEIKKLQFLVLSNNSLSGQFPAFLQNNTDLEFLDLAWNKFYGRLPTWIGELESLRFLLLSHNALSDTIPAGITNLGYLQCLDLSDNKFSGGIPWHLSNLTFMTKLKGGFMPMFDGDGSTIHYKVFVGSAIMGLGSYFRKIGAGHLAEILSVITKGQQLMYGRTIAYFVSIDLSGNSLTGEIPPDITSLVFVMNLNLSSNQLSGQIPNMIGAMRSLVSLDLSKNKLSGEIPPSIASVTSLSYLNLSYNNLSGRIPSGPQLDILNSDNPSVMYIGNSGLCGPPLQKNCSGNDSQVESRKQEFEPMTFYFGLVLGLVAGLWLVFCALLFKKTWRIAYFRLFDKAYDRIYVFVVVKWASFTRNTTAE